MDQQTSNPKFVKYIWWKGIVIGPFTQEQISLLKWENVEVFIDEALVTNIIPRTEPLNEDMRQNPNVPHFLFQQTNGT